jgi:hypothetical protein
MDSFIKQALGSAIRTGLAAIFGAAMFKGVDAGVLSAFIQAASDLGVALSGLLLVLGASLLQKYKAVKK